jgi:uncharacterized protein YdhG (YjbR/CyaY superfamily)
VKAFESVAEYIAAQPRAQRTVLERVRRTIRSAVPGGQETISYGIPTYKRHGRPVLYFAAWKEHYSIYPSNDRIVAAFRKPLAPYKLAKGTIRFPLDEPVPVRLIAGIARLRAKEVDEREKTRAATPRKR